MISKRENYDLALRYTDCVSYTAWQTMHLKPRTDLCSETHSKSSGEKTIGPNLIRPVIMQGAIA